MLVISDLMKTYRTGRRHEAGETPAVSDLSMTVEAGELFTLLGPSGCGKTTTLRCVAGLEKPDTGHIEVGERVLFSSEDRVNVPANQRDLGMVFQSYAIWPHMDVFANVAFPLRARRRRKGIGRGEIVRRTDEALATVQLTEFRHRRATDLSGGQQQRLALARALVMESPLMLLDEPLSNLDAKLRDEMRFELKRLQRELGITAVYVTHDQVEALALSTRIAVMRAGSIEQMGRPRDVYDNPSTRFVADFIGTTNFLPGTVTAKEGANTYQVETADGRLLATSGSDLPVGTAVTVTIRPQHLVIEKEPAPVREAGTWPGVVRTRAFLGEVIDYLVTTGEFQLRVRCSPDKSVPPDTEITVRFPEAKCSLLPEVDA